ncbi:MAG: hypothetical protein AABY26_03060, partial [Nanoarchaeota archaeon]
VLGYGALIAGLGFGGYFVYNTYSNDSSSPVIEGEVLEASFSSNDGDYVLIKTLNDGEVRVNFITGGQAYRLTSCGNEFQGDVEKLKNMITVGKSLEVRVKEDEGVERTACKLLRIDTPEEAKPSLTP